MKTKRVLSTILVSSLIVLGTYSVCFGVTNKLSSEINKDNNYPIDINNHWAKENILYLIQNEIVSGYDNGTIKPNSPITRIETVVVLAKALGLTETNETTIEFADNHDIPTWAIGYLNTAVDLGIISGYKDNTFRPYNSITRVEMTVMVMKAFGIEKIEKKIGFIDEKSIGLWAKAYIAGALDKGLISGYSQDNTFRPNNIMTRAEAFTIISNAMKMNNKINEEKKDEDDSSQKLDYSYKIVDTGVVDFYSDIELINEPIDGEEFYGQDAHYQINTPSYMDNGDGTITDNVTGLMWQKDMGEKMTYDEAFTAASESRVGGYDDWRVPTIKELYSLIQFTGKVEGEKAIDYFIDTNYFNQPLGDISSGEREIDAQTWTSTEYVGRTMNNDETVFGVNFIDGRIKGYPKYDVKTNEAKKMYFRLVRGNTEYGKNNFIDNNDGTISDLSTGLMWQKADDGQGRDWKESLNYAESLDLAGYSDWRLPNAKELQSIVDYSRSPQTTNSAAINPIFDITSIIDPEGNINYPFFWTSTTHQDGKNPYDSAAYVSFGEAQGKMFNNLMDVHGAGAQRSDPKSGNENNYPEFFGPQGDIRYVYNYVRCVRTIDYN